MKKILLTLAVFVAALASSAQSVIPNGWYATFEPVSDANELNGIKTASAADGSVYVSSTYNKAFTFGGKEVADPEGLTSACIVKYNEKGQEQWAVTLEGSAVVYALDTDADGTLYAAGSFIDVVKYTGTDGTTGELAGGADAHSAFVAKISKDGKVESVKTIAPVINAAILESFMYSPEPNYVYVTPNNIQIDGEKVYVSATYTADVEELGWKATYLNVFDFMYMENKSAGIFSLDKANLANPTSVATVQNTENISYNQYYPEALDFTADNGTVYVGFFGFGNLTLATPAGNKDFTFGISADESGNKEHAFVLATIGSDVNAKVFNTEMHAKDAKPYKVYMEKSGDNLFIGGTFFGQLPFDAQKNSGELASDIFTASVKAADFSTNWTFVGQSESDALSMSVNGETVLISSKNIFHIINIANGEVQNTKEQTLIATDACGMTCLSAITCSETVLGVSGKYNATSSEGETSIDTWIASFEPVSDANELNGIKTASAADGSVYVSSTYNKAFTFGGKEVADPEGLTSACIVKYNEKGQEQWAVTLEGSAVVYALDTDADGTLYAAGSFMDKVVYAGTDGEKAEITSEGVYSAFIAKIDNNGKFGIVKVITPTVNEEIASKMGDPWGMGEESPLYSMWDPIYVTPNKIQVDGEKVYVSAKYMGDVKELDWKGSYIDVFGMMYSDNYSMGVFSLKKADFTEAVNIANVQATGIVTDMQYYPEALDFTAENGTVYVGFFGFGNLTLDTPAGNKDFTFGISTDESGNKEHAFVLATIGSDVNAKVFNTEMHAKDAKPYNLFMENDGENLIIGGTFFGQLPFDTAKNSGEFASDVFMASLKKADASVNWTMTGAKEAEAICMSTYKENTIMATTANETVEIANANGETITTKEQTLSDVDAYSPTNKSAVYCAETKVYVRGQFDPSESAIDDIKDSSLQKEEGATYNLSGQKVGKNYKGIVIKNGKKYLVK